MPAPVVGGSWIVAPGGVLGRSGPLELLVKILLTPGGDLGRSWTLETLVNMLDVSEGMDMGRAARGREVPSWEPDLGNREEDK